ncbi:MAG: prolyl oligopeptidase family serine peptidase [Pseudanabaena sp. ELA607]
MTHTAPYGSWLSPITSELLVAGSLRLGQLAFDGSPSYGATAPLYWNEGRPSEGGRNVLVCRQPDGTISDVIPEGYNVRTRVHEYGGGDFVVERGRIYFANFTDQYFYRFFPERDLARGNAPEIMANQPHHRYADPIFDHLRGRIICIAEQHPPTGGEPKNLLVSLSAINQDPDSVDMQVLAQGADFYSTPRLSPDGTKLAWLQWHHPNMPWDGTELWLGDLTESGAGLLQIANARLIAGGMNESIFQPEWSPNGTLYFVSDRSNWWNLYRYELATDSIVAIAPKAAEFGIPQWVFGMSTYGFTHSGTLVCSYTEQGRSYLATMAPDSTELTVLDLPFTSISGVKCHGEQVAFIGGTTTTPSAIVLLELNHDDSQVEAWQIIRSATSIEIAPELISIPQSITFPTSILDGILDGSNSGTNLETDRDSNSPIAHGLFYLPCNPNYTAPTAAKPPLLIKLHGGPTAATSMSLSLGIQYWTSRGFAILDLNYRGSTGYGRAYRDQLKQNWGIADVADCVYGAQFLAAQGWVDPQRLCISGGSAGGYTTLCALTFYDTFKAGASYYGISDLEALAHDTHKFESRYLDSLVGAYPATKERYIARSPIHFPEKLNCAIAFFQGLEDKVVPPNQAEMMVNVLRQKGLPVAYVTFAGEQHGFRQAANIRRALDGEFYFYAQIFGFEPAENLPPITIENL